MTHRLYRAFTATWRATYWQRYDFSGGSQKGYGTLVVDDVAEWARSIDADRIDLGATLEGQRIYKRAGFVPTAPRLKLVL